MFPLVYFVRHGQTAWNAEYRLQGQADTDMTALGRSQADRNGRRLAELIDNPDDFDFVASPLRRTRETMERVRAAMRLPADGYRTDPRLIEVHFGDWQGFTFAELEAREPGLDGGARFRQMGLRAAGERGGELRDAAGARASMVRGADAPDGLRHPWRGLAHDIPDGRGDCRETKPRPWTSSRTAC